MVDKKASDLFFTTHAPVMIKIDGKIMPVNKMELTPKMVRQAALELMNENQLEEFTRNLEIDFAVSEGILSDCPIALRLRPSKYKVKHRMR